MRVLRLVLTRLIISAPVMVGLITIAFAVSHIIPGDPAALAAGQAASQETIERIRRNYGLDKPVWEQYVRFWASLAKGDLGQSIMSGRKVRDDIGVYFPATLELTIVAFAFAASAGILLGVLSARNHGKQVDQAIQVLSISGLAMPQFWLALLLQLLAARTGILPITGRLDAFTPPPTPITGLYLVDSLVTGNWPVFGLSIAHIILPAISLAFVLMGIAVRMTRANMLDVMHKDYVFNARAAAGLPFSIIHYKYTLKNALIPVVSQLGLNFGYLLTGSLLVETVFNWPGIGLYVSRAAVDQDFQPILGGVIITGLVYLGVNLLTDIVYGILDPRIVHTDQA